MTNHKWINQNHGWNDLTPRGSANQNSKCDCYDENRCSQCKVNLFLRLKGQWTGSQDPNGQCVFIRSGQPKTKRVRTCTITSNSNLQLAVDTLSRSLFRTGVSKLSESAAMTLHSKTFKSSAVKRKRPAPEAKMTRLGRPDLLLSSCYKLVRASRLVVVRSALKKQHEDEARAER